jgi:hypothetical protein
MLVPFESLPLSSRVWIYQSNRKLSLYEKQLITEKLTDFVNQWSAHGQPLKASFLIEYDHFIILAADESYRTASGCSIDDSVRVVKETGGLANVDFFDRSQVAFLNEGQVLLIKQKDLKEKFKEGMWNEHTLTFNNLANTITHLRNEWICHAGKTWLTRYVPQQTFPVNEGNL